MARFLWYTPINRAEIISEILLMQVKESICGSNYIIQTTPDQSNACSMIIGHSMEDTFQIYHRAYSALHL